MGLTYGQSVASEDAVKAVLAVISETLDVGKAAGVEFADWKQPGSQMGISPLVAQVRKKEDLANATMIMQLGWSIPIKPSMWQDIEKGGKTRWICERIRRPEGAAGPCEDPGQRTCHVAGP